MDEILEVNHVTIRGISHHDASTILRNTPTNVHLALGRTKDLASSKRRSGAASRDSSLLSDRSSSPALERYSSDPSLFKNAPSGLLSSDGSGSVQDLVVQSVADQEPSGTPKSTIVKLVKVYID